MQPGIPAIPFALVSAQATHDVIDYRTREGQSLFRSAMQNLCSESSEMFNCDPDRLMDFIQLIEDRSNMLGYQDLFLVTYNSDPANPVGRPFLKNYGILSLEQFQVHAATYALAQGRMAKESEQIYYAIMNSLSATGRAKISVWSTDYTMPHGQPDGLMLLRVIIRESDVDTQATADFIRQQLAALDEYIGTVDSNINNFNTHVKYLTRDLGR